MGGKQTRKRKHLYFFIVSLIFLFSGCSLLKEMQGQGEARDGLVRAQRLLARGDYEGALKENQKVLSLFEDRPPGDEALFHLALIYSHADYPKNDYRMAMGLFRKLMKNYPQSPFAEQAKIWVGVLQANEKLTQANEELTQANEKLGQANEKLTELIEKSKQVDIEIEEKKRKK